MSDASNQLISTGFIRASNATKIFGLLLRWRVIGVIPQIRGKDFWRFLICGRSISGELTKKSITGDGMTQNMFVVFR